MLTSTEKLQDAGFGERIFTKDDLARFLGGTPARRYGLVNKALAKGELIRICRGVYMLAAKYRSVQVSQFFVANQTVAGSYISFESALSYHGWIPERVSIVTSVIGKGRTRIFETPLGEFRYVFLPVNNLEFLSGVSRQVINRQPFFMANPLRALADYVYANKIAWTSIDFLWEGLRIEPENLKQLTWDDFSKIQCVFRSKRVQAFLQHLQPEIFVPNQRQKTVKAYNTIINDRLNAYTPETVEEEADALKEILQAIILNGLSNANFFDQAIFHGGSCLRIVHHLPRFSEDLDFLLKRVNPNFRWQPYQKAIEETCQQYGIVPEIKDKSKIGPSVPKMFFKDNSIGKLLKLSFKHHPHKKLLIKLEIDINPPAGSTSEMRFLDFPLDFPIEAQDLSSSFASKSHALLCRTYVKGRDWYDFLWYLKKSVKPNLVLLSNALNQQAPWAGQAPKVTLSWYIQAIENKIKSINWAMAKRDVYPFLRNPERKTLAFWSTAFFLEKLAQLESLYRNSEK